MKFPSHRTPRIVRMLLGAFPATFRARYGHEIWLCIRDARRDLGDDSFARTILFWTGIAANLGLSALIEWRRCIPREIYVLALRRTVGALLIAAALANIAYDAMSIKLSMGVFAALLTAVSAIAGTLLLRNGLRRRP